LLTPRDNQLFATQPTLLCWTQPQPGVLTVPADTVQRGTALAAIRLSIDRTPPATDFTIPATFLRVESVTGERGRSLAYSSHKAKWIENASRTTNTRLRFELPPAVWPCRLTQAEITIKLNAPSRELLVNAVVEKQDTLIRRITNPNGVYKISVDRPEWLTVDERGGVLFSLVITESDQERPQGEQLRQGRERESGRETSSSAGAPPGERDEANLPSSFTTWQIEYVRMDVRGTTQ
jgi:hypothetical protein